ncbi:MAG: hypothetical protein COV74_05755 [Candidatus Omnitrophica bacterium CG11_big_fil_rev_8_21_14_0_20_45_26]|uniref:Helix-turn-helix domain-containing protein n=1 Tax=Candidatus Abzuiibacterium crystallinum TaxID=1974748 RepID=A0A2H0LP94_9BACT|nr:MAG: hypothetical protein COV74_05755 [Candidatus Omnitrophica bacterium CG11_big_fil_rev_8_21_14_0_20_45_26]PIW65249.1 MAG: hypothetical protein COW12_02605 [Candidatus Omnitrophica bacterium CG12_big_fil_rev_8_21_14_0_65_45_16]
MAKSEKYLSIPQAAKLMGLSRIAVYKQVTAGKIKAIRIGRNFAILRSAIKTPYTSRHIKSVTASALTQRPVLKLVSLERKRALEKGVRKVVGEYGETLKLLGNE